jgi:ribonucleotide reductase beta subunit family protein with ferritin-like domain
MYPKIKEDARRTFLPIGRPELYEHYKIQMSMYWTPSKIEKELDTDYVNFVKLRESEQKMIKFVLVFFEYADTLASRIFGDQGAYLGPLADIPEVRYIMNYQTMIEDIHALQYSLLNEVYIKNDTERAALRSSIEEFSFVNDLLKWVDENLNRADPATNLFLMSLFEGVIFTGVFAIIFAYGDILKGLRLANEYISKDEGKHHETSGLIAAILLERLPRQRAIEITEQFLSLSDAYMKEIIPTDSPRGISYEGMAQYLRYKADNNFILMGYSEPHYRVQNPFKWMAKYNLAPHTAPHERKATNYSAITGDQARITHDDLAELINFSPVAKKLRLISD